MSAVAECVFSWTQVRRVTSCPEHTCRRTHELRKERKRRLFFYNGAKSTSLGTCVLTLQTKKGVQHKQTFQVVETGITPLLGAQAVQEMDLISVNFENIAALENSLSARAGITKENFIFKFPSLFRRELGCIEGMLH